MSSGKYYHYSFLFKGPYPVHKKISHSFHLGLMLIMGAFNGNFLIRSEYRIKSGKKKKSQPSSESGHHKTARRSRQIGGTLEIISPVVHM